MTQEPEERNDLIDDHELVTLLQSVQTHPEGGATEEEFELLFNWANRVRVEGFFLGFLLDGSAAVVGFEGEHPRLASMEHAVAREAIAAAESLLLGHVE